MNKEKIMNILEPTLKILGVIVAVVLIVKLAGGDKRNHKQNETITYNGAEYRIKSIKKEQDLITAVIHIKNTSNNIIKYDEINFNLLNENNKYFDKKELVTVDGTFTLYGEINPNEEAECTVIWKNTIDYKNLKIRYYENPIMDKVDEYQFEWELDK